MKLTVQDVLDAITRGKAKAAAVSSTGIDTSQWSTRIDTLAKLIIEKMGGGQKFLALHMEAKLAPEAESYARQLLGHVSGLS